MKRRFPLQFITAETERYSHYDAALLALEGGCRWIQLRIKDAMEDEVEKVARRIQELCHNYEACLIIDDYVEVAKRIQADGVHLGKHDMPITEARRLLGEGFIIGGTANTFEDVERLAAEGADYIGCGPFRFTTTKKNLSPILGLEGYRHIVNQMHEAGIRLPIVAIGGITCEDIPALMETGVTGIAMSGAILNAPAPVEEILKVMNL